MRKQISIMVTPELKEQLTNLKFERRKRSYNELIKSLLPQETEAKTEVI